MNNIPLTNEELKKLTTLVAGLYQFREGGTRGRFRLVEAAGVGAITGDIQMDGPAPDVAWDMVRRVARYGNLGQTQYHALGALLSHILTLNDLPQDDAADVAQLIVKYGLVNDQSYLANLRRAYRLDVTPVRAPAGRSPVAVAPPAFDESPPFTPAASVDAALEQIITSRDNFLDLYTLIGAVYAARFVCLLEMPEGTARGTGFLVGPDLLLTNQHVLKDSSYLATAIAHFDYRKDHTGAAPAGRRIRLDPSFYHSSPAEQLDYALVRLAERPVDPSPAVSPFLAAQPSLGLPVGQHAYLPLSEDIIRGGDRINILQHPGGDPLKVVLTQNRVVEDMTATRVQYLADTDAGSSGSPVCNQRWEVVALHHSGGPYPPPRPGDPNSASRQRFLINEGIPIRAILADLRAKGLADILPSR